MLKLRKVEILGFKSFCEKTQITFSGSGITCIVGPNGCGKSNVVDAISWVLGEQSHKSLRAERMSDCIFNGTAKRPPLGLAEVSITLVDPELEKAAEFVLEGKESNAEGTEAAEQPQAGARTPEGLPVEAADGVNLSAESTESATDGTEQAAAIEPGVKRFKKRPAKPLPQMRPGEVVVGRRLYRSGQSEYLLNGRPARLRDIQEIFMGTGLGPESYAIIEQGRIGQILSTKPTDRRAIIEEAAGVSKYKTKRRLAEAKLESSKINLARVNDIVVEVEKQLASLKRQASKARRYAEIREQMRGIIRTVLASKARELELEAERLERLLRDIAATESTQSQSLHEREAELERLNARIYELETEIRRNQNLLNETSLELDRAENRIGFNRERSRELELRVTQIAAQAQVEVAQADELERQAYAHAQTVEALRAEHGQVETAIAAMVEAASRLSAEQIGGETRIEELRHTAGRLGDELTRLHTEQAQAEAALAHHADARTRAEQHERQLQLEAGRQRERFETEETHYSEAQAQSVKFADEVRLEQTRIAELRARQVETTERYDLLREQLAGARARRGSLEQILNERSYTADAVQKLFAANSEVERGFRAVGLLADYAEVEEQHEAAVEQFLREELEYVIVETFDHARAGVAMLRNEVGGRATFFVDSLNKLNLTVGEGPMPFRADQGVISRMDKLVGFKDPLGPAAKQFLPKLRTAFLVQDAATAEKLAHENTQFYFVIPDGTCYHGRLVSGGRPGEAGPLAMKRELRSVESEALRLERATEEAHAGLRWLEDEIATRQRALEIATQQHLEAEKALVAATHLRDAARMEFDRSSAQLREAQVEIARLTVEAEAAERRAEAARAEREGASQSRAGAETEAAQISERLVTLRVEIAAKQEEISARRADLATMAERVASAESIQQQRAAQVAEIREREAGLRMQHEALSNDRAEVEASTAELLRQVEGLAAEKARLTDVKAASETEWEQARVRVVEIDDALRMTRQQLGDLREQRAQHEIEKARNESDRNHLRETCLAELNAHPEDLIAQEQTLMAGEELAVAETNYKEMRAKIEAMGPVNMMALEEYQECEQRFAFLTRERDDLLKSIEDTRQTITELDEVSRTKFAEAFAIINKNFAQAFTTLFGGGHGEMRMTEAVDSSGDTGIDIVAQPPGKRLQNVLLLSGGEKALTAVALLIAIFRYQPSPFCILDEVDAPLDEANVGRFNKMLGEMAAQTQFICVTHNRRTMEMGSVLYGVTMQEPGVSKLVSVRWDEPAQAQPEPSAAPNAA